eukprot:Selendium_serpulae@DN5513_c1_g1_i1.p2
MKNVRSTQEVDSVPNRAQGGRANQQSTEEIQHRGKKITGNKAHPDGIYREEAEAKPCLAVTGHKNAISSEPETLPLRKIQENKNPTNIITNPPEDKSAPYRKVGSQKNADAFSSSGMNISADVRTTDQRPEPKFGREPPTAKDGPFEHRPSYQHANSSSLNRNLQSRDASEAARQNVKTFPQTNSIRPAPFAME